MASRSFPEASAAWRAAPGCSFSAAAGPLPDSVAREVSEACRPGPGSILSLPFTSAAYRGLQAETEACLRRLLAIPDDFAVLFMPGGASAQFAMLPMNLLGGCGDGHAEALGERKGGDRSRCGALYIASGHWSRRAIAEARRYGEVAVAGIDGRLIADGDETNEGDAARGHAIPRGERPAPAAFGEGASGSAAPSPARSGAASSSPATSRPSAGPDVPWPARCAIEVPAGRFAYAHFTSNETADGLRFPVWPEVALPLAADMTSDLLSRPLDWQRLGLVYAGMQKTVCAPGLALVVVRRSLLGRALACTPKVMNYAALAEADSRLCTPPVPAVFVAHRMLHWIEAEGGVPVMAARLARRHALVQAALAEGNTHGQPYRQALAPAWRSPVNPCFQLPDVEGCDAFLAAAETAGLRDLGGHPAHGGVRVSLYHGVRDDAVETLADFLVTFARHRSQGGRGPRASAVRVNAHAAADRAAARAAIPTAAADVPVVKGRDRT